jgi:hypothetical protein
LLPVYCLLHAAHYWPLAACRCLPLLLAALHIADAACCMMLYYCSMLVLVLLSSCWCSRM